MAPVVGIDLGTCYSCVGTFREGAVEIIPNGYGKRVSPSYVAFRGGERLLGESALDQAAYNSENTVYEVKRLIGRNFEDATVKEDIQRFPFRVIKVGGVKTKVSGLPPNSYVMVQYKTFGLKH